MSEWLDTARDLESGGVAYVLVTVLGARGSTPRDNGTKMLVTADRSFCTIGGGHLEYRAMDIARELLCSAEAQQHIEVFPLGASLGQCCGGSTHVLFESFPGSEINLMLFGAGHVGKALVSILAQLPCRVHWVDSRCEQFPAQLPANVERVLSEAPADEVASMPAKSYYLIMTHNHPLDFDITQAVIKRGDARYIGLIGSATKWRRFQMRFQHRGYAAAQYASVHCPVGLAQVPGKLPMEVATSIAAELISQYQGDRPARETQRGVGWRELQPLMAAAAEVATEAGPTDKPGKAEVPVPGKSNE